MLIIHSKDSLTLSLSLPSFLTSTIQNALTRSPLHRVRFRIQSLIHLRICKMHNVLVESLCQLCVRVCVRARSRARVYVFGEYYSARGKRERRVNTSTWWRPRFPVSESTEASSRSIYISRSPQSWSLPDSASSFRIVLIKITARSICNTPHIAWSSSERSVLFSFFLFLSFPRYQTQKERSALSSSSTVNE